MRQSDNKPSAAAEDSQFRTERLHRATPKALVWLLIAAVAAFPFPWWW